MEKFSDRATYKGIVLIGNFPPVVGKDFLCKGQKLKGPTNSKRKGAGLFYRPTWKLLFRVWGLGLEVLSQSVFGTRHAWRQEI